MRCALILLLAPLLAAQSSSEISQRLTGSIDGPTLYKHHCAACHGADAKGGGPTAAVLKISVPDLTLISRRNKGKFPAPVIEKIINGEMAVVTPAHGSRQMPIWGPVFSQVEWDQNLGKIRVHNLVKYIESLQRK